MMVAPGMVDWQGLWQTREWDHRAGFLSTQHPQGMVSSPTPSPTLAFALCAVRRPI